MARDTFETFETAPAKGTNTVPDRGPRDRDELARLRRLVQGTGTGMMPVPAIADRAAPQLTRPQHRAYAFLKLAQDMRTAARTPLVGENNRASVMTRAFADFDRRQRATGDAKRSVPAGVPAAMSGVRLYQPVVGMHPNKIREQADQIENVGNALAHDSGLTDQMRVQLGLESNRPADKTTATAASHALTGVSPAQAQALLQMASARTISDNSPRTHPAARKPGSGLSI